MTHTLQDVITSMPSASNRDLQDFIQQSTEANPAKDLHNLRSKMRHATADDEATKIEQTLNVILDEGGSVEINTSEGGDLHYIAFMTAQMKDMCSKHPELLVMDVTYKCKKNCYPLLNVLCIDSEGKGIPVYHVFLVENKENISHALTFFAAQYDSGNTRTFFIDKDMSEKFAINQAFLYASVRLCSFHVSQAVKRALQGHKVQTKLIDCLLGLFKQMREALDESTYLEVPYACLPCDYNHAESYHQKIKSTQRLNAKVTLSSALTDLLRFDARVTRCRQASSYINQMTYHYSTTVRSPVVSKIMNDLTPFASDLVCQQLSLAERFTCNVSPSDDGFFLMKYGAADLANKLELFEALFNHVLHDRQVSIISVLSPTADQLAQSEATVTVVPQADVQAVSAAPNTVASILPLPPATVAASSHPAISLGNINIPNRRGLKRKVPVPSVFAEKSDAEQIELMVSSCVVDINIVPPYESDNIKSLDDLHSLCTNENVDLNRICGKFTRAWRLAPLCSLQSVTPYSVCTVQLCRARLLVTCPPIQSVAPNSHFSYLERDSQ
ncbi:hypothetical protein CAPTEDRAFT_184925 [Capitella teleta]|uniref:ZSWIM1/3 RNaseH-like domain-containing protein n=1 Tax=Capitella teleta TaxID=283909 RepID=R7V1P6_CAPTE|nr:hypothetical protein CAPTEDRAFT_184925 [Capitella teleta]|eukprot:ELU10241.1 hypothetical protein CAPTEDRAFT_184925 [Capitella teleta]